MKSHGSAGAYNHELYNCDVVVSACQDVILLELESNGTKTTIENKKRIKHPNHPYCRVIIDNREGYQIVAIEKNAAFSGDTDKAALVLQKGFNQKLSVYGRRLSFSLYIRKLQISRQWYGTSAESSMTVYAL